MGFSLEGKDALRYANLRLLPADFAANLRWLRVAIRRVVVYGSAVAIAIVISGGIFSLTPLVGIRLVHTQGTSMEPRQKNGDVILVKEVNGARAQIGDVVVFEDDGRSFMHRVIQRYTDASGRLMLVTQGDNVPVPDHPILASQVKARMLTEIPVLGDASRLVHGKGGFYAYRSLMITISVFCVALWGLTASAKAERQPPQADDSQL